MSRAGWAIIVAAIVLLASYAATAEPACQSKKNPVACEVGGQCIWVVAKGKKSKCVPAKVAPRR